MTAKKFGWGLFGILVISVLASGICHSGGGTDNGLNKGIYGGLEFT